MPVFTESKKGYDKEEVNNFIKQINEANEAKIAEKDEKIKSLENEVKRLTKKCEGLQNNESDENAKATSENEADAAKKKYEKLCSDMGEKLLLAEVKASEVIEEAEKKAEKIVADARINANDQIEKILADAKASCDGIKKAVSEYSAKEREILALLNTTEETFKLALERISSHIYKG